MRMISLTARQTLTYGGRPVGAGERFDATPIDAAVLTYQRRADFTPRGPLTAPPAPPSQPPDLSEAPTEAPARKKRAYHRRDLKAEA